MDRKIFEKAKSIDFETGHIRGAIARLERGKNVFHIVEEFQNVIDPELLQKIQADANAKVLEILKKELSDLDKQLEDL